MSNRITKIFRNLWNNFPESKCPSSPTNFKEFVELVKYDLNPIRLLKALAINLVVIFLTAIIGATAATLLGLSIEHTVILYLVMAIPMVIIIIYLHRKYGIM